MRTPPHAVAALVLALVAKPLSAQHAQLPWKVGDSPPAVAGIHLGDSRRLVDSILGPPDTVDAPSVYVDGERIDEWQLTWSARGVFILYSRRDGVTGIRLSKRVAGDVDGIRVGDSLGTVIRQ